MMRQFIVLCAAAALLAGSTAAHALKIVDSTGDDPAMDGRASNTYAKETLVMADTTDATDKADTTTYYDIAENSIILSAPADVTANAGDTYLVTYTLDGMVFRDDLANTDLTPTGFSVAAGGKAGDKSVVYRLGATGTVAATTTLVELSAEFAISAAGSGSVTRTVTNQTLAALNVAGVTGTMSHTASGAIKLGSGLMETAMPMNQVATVEHGFRSFNAAGTVHLGSLQVTFNPMVRRADQDDGAAPNALDAQIIDAGLTDTTPNSTVEMMGDFSFATAASLHGDNDCSDQGTDTDVSDDPALLTIEGEGDERTVTVNKVNVTAVAEMQYLCITVDTSDEGMRIPETVPYMAMGSYAKVDGRAFDPEPGELTLGRITRDGTTVHLPYLTTNAKFNQRLYVVNRGPDPVVYEMDFQEGDTAGMMASGTLMPGRTTLSVGDLVTVGEGGSTSGSLIIEAQPGMIDVATVQVNRELGTTDTVVYQ